MSTNKLWKLIRVATLIEKTLECPTNMLWKSIRVATLIEKNVGLSMEMLRKSIRVATLIEKAQRYVRKNVVLGSKP